MKDLHKLLALVVLAHVGAVIGLVALWDPVWLLLSLVAFFAFFLIGHDLYNHRYLSHSSFEMSRPLQIVCSLLGVFVLFGTPIGIASAHARHHRHADTDLDPHPAHHGWKAWFWVYPELDSKQDVKTVRRLLRDPWVVFLSKNYFRIYIGTAIVAALIDPRIAIYGMFLPVAYGFFGNGMVNVVCHRWGYKNFASDDNARNNHLSNALLLFGGISMHNNHHARPGDFFLSTRRGEIDLVGLIIGAIRSRP